MITRKIAPALAAGRSAVVKTPREISFSALALCKPVTMAGIPEDCFHVVPTCDREVAAELLKPSKVKKLGFTGLTAVGKKLTTLVAQTIERVIIKLGGNAPFLVYGDADLELAVARVMVCKFQSSGQTRGIDDGTTQGPVVNAAAVRKVAEHGDDALSKGATVQADGKTPSNLLEYF
ncbi:hypothetical protein CBS147353_10662 [Aspergillus niger]|nr:hypothetical protein CBS147353_10662 [Aspergillus niger]